MIDTIRILFLAGVVMLAVALLPPSPPTVAQTPCQRDDYCHAEAKRACAGKACNCFACHSDREFCCYEGVSGGGGGGGGDDEERK